MHVFSWNINGITPFLQNSITSYFERPCQNPPKGGIPPSSLRDFLRRHDWPSVLFLQEVKIAFADIKTQDAVRSAVNASGPSDSPPKAGKGPKYDVYFTLPNDRHNARGPGGSGKVYGVASIVRSDLLSRFEFESVRSRTVDWDSEGRIQIIELASAPVKLALFNIYAVNGTENAYRSPVNGAVSGTRHDRKLAFHRLLRNECVQLGSNGWDIVLAGDFNVAPDERDGWPKLRVFPKQHVLNRADFLQKFLDRGGSDNDGAPQDDCKGWKGVDVWREVHGEQRGYTYYPRNMTWGSSCDRVDYAIVGRKTWEKSIIKGCGILESEVERGPSDHCPIWVDIEVPLK
ncbi:DNase I-like protein [Polyplosphaeria fusca]|uniref:DNase I-like protein n=1 Tax=Polyplosphaeria fusca TaxID=682080 RepID=A0A9P4R6N8_9PLEO|nr:DNase I-like protein [Polyplosphaeria fusca]